MKVRDYELKTILSRLRRPEICAPDTYYELIRTPKMQHRLLALALVKKPVTEREQRRVEREKRADEVARLKSRYDRATLYEQVWSQPVLEVAKEYAVSGVRLGSRREATGPERGVVGP